MEGGKGHMGKFPSKPLFLPHFLPNLGRKQNTPKWWAQGEITHAPTNAPHQNQQPQSNGALDMKKKIQENPAIKKNVHILWQMENQWITFFASQML